MGIESINPATGEVLGRFSELSEGKVEMILSDAQRAFLAWRRTRFARRAELMYALADRLQENALTYARLMACEMGKPLAQGRSEVEKCAWVCRYYAEHAETFLCNEPVATDAHHSFVTFQPLGIVLAVMPWNFPFWQVFRFAAPGLMAGNVALLKHASNVPQCAVAIEEAFCSAGFPPNVFTNLLVGSRRVADIIQHPHVAAVTLTGSTAAGQEVARVAGGALKKTVLELGGSDPYLILKDADVDQAVKACVTARLLNGGQSCIAAKRFLVVTQQLVAFEQQMVEQMSQKKMGDPLLDETEVGPLARHDLRQLLHEQVQRSVQQGARCLLGGEIPDGAGAFYPPTVLTDVRPGMPACDEELFGPVAAIIPVADDAQAIRRANESCFGLGAAVFTRNLAEGERIAAEELDAGCCFVNDFVRSDPRLPFGGVKASGYGRELSHFGIREFVNIKTVYVR